MQVILPWFHQKGSCSQVFLSKRMNFECMLRSLFVNGRALCFMKVCKESRLIRPSHNKKVSIVFEKGRSANNVA